MASSNTPATIRLRRPKGRRGGFLLWILVALLVSACSSPSHPGGTPAVCYLVLENLTEYTWAIEATPVAEDLMTGPLNWQVAPATAITVELAAPQTWRLTQSLRVHGTSRTTDFSGEPGVTYRWPLATLHSAEPAR